MKKKIIIFSIITFISIFFITGCGKKETVEETPKENLVRNASKDKIKITYTGVAKSHSVIYFVKNKDEIVARDVTIEVEFWGKEKDEETGEDKDVLVATSKKTFDFIAPSTTVAGEAAIGHKEYTSYKIFVDVDKKVKPGNYEIARDDVIIEDDTKLTLTDEEIEEGKTPDEYLNIVFKNKGKKRISYIELGIVFYKDGDIVGFSKQSKENLDPKMKSKERVTFPVGEYSSDKVEFDSYRIYINEAYKSSYGK